MKEAQELKNGKTAVTSLCIVLMGAENLERFQMELMRAALHMRREVPVHVNWATIA